MTKIGLVTLLVMAMAAIGIPACSSGTDSNNNQNILLGKLPDNLATRLTAQQAEFSKSLATATGVATEEVHMSSVPSTDGARQAVIDLNLKKPETIKSLSEKMRDVGPAVLPDMEGLLTSQDDATREKAVFALRCLMNRGENSPTEATSADKLITLLLRRAVYDRSFRVRESAIIGLSAIGFSGREALLDDVLAGLTDARNDPDSRNSNRAKDNVQLINDYAQHNGSR